MKSIWWGYLLLAIAVPVAAQTRTSEEDYEASGFSNFWDEPTGSARLNHIQKAVHPAQVQGIIHTYLRENPASFMALVPHIRDMQTWATAGAFANTILEEGMRREQDTNEVEKLLAQNTPKDLVGAVVAPILRQSMSPSDSAVNIILSAPDTIQALNAMVLLMSWEQLRPLIARAVQQAPPDQQSDLTARVQAWYHQ